MDLKERVAALNALGQRRPTPARLAQVQEALVDKFEGIQAAALKVLGTWGDAESCKLARKFLIDAFDRPGSYSVRGVAVKALIPHVGETDVDWVLDLYFGLPSVVTKHELFQLVLALPPELARKRLLKMLKDSDPANRQAAAKAIANLE